MPDRDAISEIYQLSDTDQQQYIKESSIIAKFLHEEFQPDKINIAALGNIVPQLHIHHVARFKTDPAWPAPIWGKAPAKAYTQQETDEIINKLKSSLTSNFEFEV